ncbi:MAG: hypothetical protein ACKVG0_13055 [Alphaproteobacteria bacterium]
MRTILTLSLALFLWSSTSARAGEFLSGFDDVPVMRGLAQQSVQQFYSSTLPQLGWEQLGDQEFSRDGERLRLGYSGQDGNLTVRFTLTPKK